MEQFDKETKEYEKIISDANIQKQKARKEIAKLEAQIRSKRDQVADIQVENRNLQYLTDRESQVIRQKDGLEKRALTELSKDLGEQLTEMQENAEKLTGKVTPFGMEQILQEKFKQTTQQYESYLKESQKDLDETDAEILQLEKELERERIFSEGLLKEKANNQRQIEELSDQFRKYKKDLDAMNEAHDARLNELHQIRQKANEEIKQLSIELGKQ